MKIFTNIILERIYFLLYIHFGTLHNLDAVLGHCITGKEVISNEIYR